MVSAIEATPVPAFASSFITTVQVIPALISTPGGTCVMWRLTGAIKYLLVDVSHA
jgi:hypothetical protein